MKSKKRFLRGLGMAFLGLVFFPLAASAQLSGKYTIDPGSAASSTNYKNFKSAVNDLLGSKRTDGGKAQGPGVGGAVTFVVYDGSYNEQIIITGISGASSSNTITFKSNSGDSSKVILYNAVTTASDTGVLTLSGAQWLRFEKLTIKATGATSNTVVKLQNAACNNSFSNCRILGVFQTSTTTGGFTTGNYSCVWTSGADTGLLFTNNRLIYGYNGFFIGSATNRTGVRIINNLIDSSGASAIYCNNVASGFLVQGNIINLQPLTSSVGHYVSYGLRMENCGAPRILKNKFFCLAAPTVSRGIVLFTNKADADGRHGILANNWMILRGGTSSASGVALGGDQYMDVYYNNVLINSTLTSGTAFYVYAGYYSASTNTTTVANNNFVNKGGGFAADIQDSGIVLMDYNNLYTTGSTLARYTSSLKTYSNLSNWHAGTGKDKNGVSMDPAYTSGLDLHVGAGGLDGKATPYSGVSDDIDGDARNSTTPDIGADEFKPLFRDGGVSRLDSPSFFCAGTKNVYVKFGNYGINPFSKIKINWSVNGTAQKTYQWSGTQAPGSTSASVMIGSYTFSSNTKYVLKIWTSAPNDSTDESAKNDTLVTDVYTGMSGSFTIGGTSPDFKTFADAVSALYTRGVCGATTFKVRSGTYPEQMTFVPIPGSSSSNTVTFMAADSNYNSVKLSLASAANGGVNNDILQFNGGKNITFQYITFSRSGTNVYGQLVEFKGGASNIKFLNNRFVGLTTNNTSADIFWSSTEANTGIVIKGNIIYNGYRAINLTGSSSTPETGVVIDGNTIDSTYTTPIVLAYSDGVIVTNNKISGIVSPATAYGIYVTDCAGGVSVSANTVTLKSVLAGIYVTNAKATSKAPGSIANNMVSLDASSASGASSAMLIGTTDYYGIVFNTLHIYGSNSSGMSFSSTGSGSGTNALLNNIYSNYSGGLALSVSDPSLFGASDYNAYDLPSSSTAIAWGKSTYSSLSGFKSAVSIDANSLTASVLYVSNTQLHNVTPAIDAMGVTVSGISTDIDGDTRNSPPDIGADEFELPANDAGITALSSSATVCEGSQAIRVVLKNFGTKKLTKATINWSIDGVTQTPYSWNNSTGLAKGDTAHVVIGTYNFSTSASLTAWTTSPNGVTDDFTFNDELSKVSIKVVPLPSAIVGKSQDLCMGSSVNLGAAAVSGNTYAWTSNPSGYTSADASPTVSPTATTTYILTETTPEGCTKTDSVKITVHPIPAPEIGSDTVQACNGQELVLSTALNTGNSYFWSGPPGFNEVTPSITIVPEIVNGVDNISYTVRETIDATGCYKEDNVVVHINDLPLAHGGSDKSTCAGSPVVIGTTGIAGNTYSWTSDPAGFTSSSDKPSVAPLVTTTYILKETNPSGCSKMDSVVVTVKATPEAKVGTPQTICEGSTVNLGAAAVSGNTYAWTSSPAGFTSSTANPTVTPKVTTTYYLTETNSTTGCNKKDSVMITVNPMPLVDVSGPATTCQGNAYIYKSPSITTSNYSWNVTGGTMNAFPTPDSIEVIWTSPTGEVSLTVTSNEGCSNTFKLAVTANAPPKAAFTATTVCLGGTTIFTNGSTGSNGSAWEFGDGAGTSTTTSPGYKYTKAGKYTVILLVRNASGCTDTVSHEVTVNALPSAGFTVTKVSGNSFNFAAKTTGLTTYAWDFGDGNTANTATTSHTYPTAGTYKVTLNVRDANSCDGVEVDTTLDAVVGIHQVDPLNGSLNVYPNPFTHSLTVAYTLPKKAQVKVVLMDVTGRVMSEMPVRTQTAGSYEYEWPINADLKPGVYMLRITTDNVPVTRTLMKL